MLLPLPLRPRSLKERGTRTLLTHTVPQEKGADRRETGKVAGTFSGSVKNAHRSPRAGCLAGLDAAVGVCMNR